MTEWRAFRGWSSGELRRRIDGLMELRPNFDGVEREMTVDAGWNHWRSESTIAGAAAGAPSFQRARVALENYSFSDPDVLTAHFDTAAPLLGRRMLLEAKVLGLRYLCPTLVDEVTDEPERFSFRYATLEGHIERGVERFRIERDERGEVRFRIEARWTRGDLPNWWSRAGFTMLARHFQRRWHRAAHHRMTRLACYGSLESPPPDASGLAHQGGDVTFTYGRKME